MKKIVGWTMSAAALMLAWGPILGAGPAQASPAGPTGRVPETWTEVVQSGAPYYSYIGLAAVKFNAASSTSTLTMTMSRTTQRSTSLQAGLSPANCATVNGTDYGYLNSIMAYPYFAERVAPSACTPRP